MSFPALRLPLRALLIVLLWCRPFYDSIGQSPSTRPAVRDTTDLPYDNIEPEEPTEVLADAPLDAPETSNSKSSAGSPVQWDMLHRLGRRLEQGAGYANDSTGYHGSPLKLYSRYRLRWGTRLRANLTLEKDPGEPFRWAPDERSFGYDHVTAYVALTFPGLVRQVVIGDYLASFGQGVTLWQPAGFGKGRESIRPLLRSASGIRAYGSTEENRFFRGAAVTAALLPSLEASFFLSSRSRDATGVEPCPPNASDCSRTFRSFGTSGLHRTATERRQKDAVHERVLGGALTLTHGTVVAGLVGYRSRLDALPLPDLPRAHGASPPARHHAMAGAHIKTTGSLLYGLGEVSRSSDGLIGGIAGLGARFSEQAELLLLARAYPAGFRSLHGFAFGDRTGRTTNETGFYAALVLSPARSWRLDAYVDHVRIPRGDTGIPRPGNTHDARVTVTFSPRRWVRAYAEGHLTRTDRRLDIEAPGGVVWESVGIETKHTGRLHLDYSFSPAVHVQSRVEGVRVASPKRDLQRGVLLYHEVRWHPYRTLSLRGRLLLFDVSSAAARVYAYESDLLYTLSVPSFTGRGRRSYVLIRWDICPGITFQVKASFSRFEDVSTLGSGRDAVSGNRRRELRIALRLGSHTR